VAEVNYNGKTVSDENVCTVLKRIATELEKDVKVTSGDRPAPLDVGAGSKSHHVQKRAADFHVDGMTDEQAFKKIQEKKDQIFDSDNKYQVIWHGPFTDTMGAHLHIGRYETGSGVSFLKEGTTAEGKGKYTVASGYAFVPSAMIAMDQIRATRFPNQALGGMC
jgi:hypothetical protein